MVTISWGSPPRVRGKGLAAPDRPVVGGITPACAGKRQLNDNTLREHGGSPPRVRGKVPVLQVDLQLRGITPACAGKR